jgi:purine-binding chemotaxis protein CheW
MHCVVFRLAGECYGVPVSHVLEVLEAPRVSAFPQAPDFVEGVVTVRGHSIVVVDLRRRLGLGGGSLDPASHMIISKVDGLVIGLLVDLVDDVLNVGDKGTDSVEDITGHFVEGKSVKGVAHYEGRDIILLDLAEALGHEERDALRSLGR